MIALAGSGVVTGNTESGDIILMMSADVEPTAGGAPHGFTSSGVPTSNTPAGVHGRAYDSASIQGNITLADPSDVISFIFRFMVTTDGSANRTLIRLNGGSTTDHTEVQYNNGGSLRVTMNVSTVLDGPTSNLISLNTWYWLVGKTTIHDTTGSFEVYLYNDSGTLLNTGADALAATGVDTRDGGATADVTNIIMPNNGLDVFWDNLVIDTTGELYGPRSRVESVGPNGAGDLTNLTASAGSNYQCVDDVPCDATDYVSSSGDQSDTYAFPNIAVSGTPEGVGVYAACAATAGTPQFNFICRISGVTYEHSMTHTSSATQQFYGSFWRNNPATGFAWTTSDINSAQFGIRWRAANGRTYGLYRSALITL